MWVRADWTAENLNLIYRSVLLISRPRSEVGHTTDVLSPFISILWHSDWLFHRESCPRLDVVYAGRAWSSACVHLALFHALFLSPGNSLVSSWYDHSVLTSLLWQCLTVPSLLPALLRTHSVVFLAVHKTRRIFLSTFISKASRRVSSFFLSVGQKPKKNRKIRKRNKTKTRCC